MTQISIDSTLAHSVAHAVKRASDQLDSARSGLSHQWASLDANWEGASKAPVEASVRSALSDFIRENKRTYDLGAKLEAIAQRFEAADEAEGTPLPPILWVLLGGGLVGGLLAGAGEYGALEADIQSRIEALRKAGLQPDNTKRYDARGAQEILENKETIKTLAKRYDIDPALLAGVLASEKDFDYSGIVSDFDYNEVLRDPRALMSDEAQDLLGRSGVDPGGGLGMASVHPPTLDRAIQYLNDKHLVGADDAKALDRSPQHRTSFEGSAEEAAIVLAMLNHAKGGAHSAEDMAVVWGGYRAGVVGVSPSGVGFESVSDFAQGKANSAPANFPMGTNAYMSTPYFKFFKKKFAE